jgi:hypothetical protein
VALSKAEVNERFYNTVGGRIVFETEAQGFLHPYAVAKLVAAQAREGGVRQLKLLELGANDCAFATSLLKMLSSLALHGEVELDRIDYFAVEYARPSLEAFLAAQEATGDFQRVTPGAPGGPLVGSLARLGLPQVNLYLVHAEAGGFVAGGAGGYDFAILNELLDDLPCRAFYSDAEGRRYELGASAGEDAGRWRVTVSATPTDDPAVAAMPPASLTATSPASVAVVAGAASLLRSGGMLLVHDYGFVERFTPVSKYEHPPRSLPEFVDLEFPPGSEEGFPRAFFRIFGSPEANVVQITTDVDFSELTDALAPGGTVITLPHGNALLATRPDQSDLREGDGVFLSEFGRLEAGEALQALLARLDAEQAGLRRRFADEFLEGRGSVFADLLFVKR